MADRRWLLGASMLLLAALACSQSPNVIITETVPSVIPTTVPPSMPGVATVTDTAPPPTAMAMADTPISSTVESPLPAGTATPTPVPVAGEHSIALGETLSCIGRGYGVLPKAIADTSGIELTSVLRVGQVLKIPFVQWTNIPAGPVCLPQFPPPFPGLPVTNPSPQPPLPATDTPTLPVTNPSPQPSLPATDTPTLQLPDTLTPTNPPFPVTFTPTPSFTATVYVPDTLTPTPPPGPTGIPPTVMPGTTSP